MNIRNKPLLERFMRHVLVTDGCWEWMAKMNAKGYGSIAVSIDGEWKQMRAHRVAWFLEHHSWPKECVCHACDNPGCVRPSHLFLGTNIDNVRDSVKKGRRQGLSPKDVMRIRSSDLSNADMAVVMGLNPSTISKIRTRKRYQDLP